MVKPLNYKFKAFTSNPKTIKKQMYNLLCVSVVFLDPFLSGFFGLIVSLTLFLINILWPNLEVDLNFSK
jgi:hypothetical protein